MITHAYQVKVGPRKKYLLHNTSDHPRTKYWWHKNAYFTLQMLENYSRSTFWGMMRYRGWLETFTVWAFQPSGLLGLVGTKVGL